MRFKNLISKFTDALTAIYGAPALSKNRETALDATIQARPGTFDSAIAASITRDVRRAQISSGRKNTRGLPKGYGLHDLKRAQKIKNRAARVDTTLTDSEINFAETFFADVRRTNSTRARRRALYAPSTIRVGLLAGAASVSFLKRVTTHWRKPSLQALAARIRSRMAAAKQTGRLPFLRPETLNRSSVARLARQQQQQ